MEKGRDGKSKSQGWKVGAKGKREGKKTESKRGESFKICALY